MKQRNIGTINRHYSTWSEHHYTANTQQNMHGIVAPQPSCKNERTSKRKRRETLCREITCCQLQAPRRCLFYTVWAHLGIYLLVLGSGTGSPASANTRLARSSCVQRRGQLKTSALVRLWDSYRLRVFIAARARVG